MERKVFGQETRFGSPKRHLLKMIRLIRGSATGNLGVSSGYGEKEDIEQPVVYNPQAYAMIEKRLIEFETEKAIILKELRHERWKAGGPV